VDIGEHRVAIVTPREGIAPGDQVTISVDPGRVLLFDGATGSRIASDDLPLENHLDGAIQPEAVGYA